MTPRRHHLPPHQAPQRFSRSWWLGKMQNILWVLLATLLIWVYADVEFTDDAKFSATLVLKTGESQKVMLLSPAEHQLQFELSGSQTSLEQFRRKLIADGAILTYDVSGEYQPGEGGAKSVPAADLLNRAAKLMGLGITVKNVTPEVITMHLEGLRKISDVPVELVATGAELVSPPPPQKVDILVPASEYEKILALPPKLKTQSIDLSEYVPGKKELVKADIIRTIEIGGEKFSIEPVPASVTFTVQIKSRTTVEEISVTVKILTPAAWAQAGDTTWTQYELLRQAPADWRPKLQIVGAKKDLQPENIRAYITLSDDDKQPVESWLEREVVVSFPPEMNLKLQGSAPKVKFKLQKRNPAAPTTP
ncbi:MAG: hypothetical protein K8S55_00855 [Phycisphaerae bacterium]|nr:hypothetical protein [Phycisphaerae bacterium]